MGSVMEGRFYACRSLGHNALGGGISGAVRAAKVKQFPCRAFAR
jgi:hypothetical protein